MSMLFPSKGREPVGNPCPETGVRTGKATVTSMDKASHSRSPRVIGALSFLTMLPLLAGPSARPSVAANSHDQLKSLASYKL
jgi:hypothetical protein